MISTAEEIKTNMEAKELSEQAKQLETSAINLINNLGKIAKDTVKDFAALAKEFSEDQGSKVQGGDLGWAKRGQMVAEFEAMAMTQDSGVVSNVVESEFGFHIIQTLDKRGQEYRARHILLRPDYSRLDLTGPKRFLDSLKHQIDIDSISFEKAIKLYSQDKNTTGQPLKSSRVCVQSNLVALQVKFLVPADRNLFVHSMSS